MLPFRKDRKSTEIKFDVRGRFEFLNGFEKRKEERRKKGNLINLKKMQKRKREEQSSYKQHVQSEYQKAVDAIRHNSKTGKDLPEQPQEESPVNVIEESTVFYSKHDDAFDPFGDVSVKVSSLESPDFTRMGSQEVNPLDENADPSRATPKPVTYIKSTKKATPTFAKLKKLTKSSQFLQNKKKRDKAYAGNKRVKSTKKSGCKKKKVHK